jgi:ABC-type multidrug transport system fused ATPase/permease subunit
MLGDFLWTLFVFFFMVIYFMMLFRIIMDVFRSQDLGGASKAFWLIFILIVPVFSMLIYVIARGPGMAKRDQEQLAEVQKQQAAYIKDVAGATGDNPADQISRAHGLLQAGAISQAEFDQLKSKALASH